MSAGQLGQALNRCGEGVGVLVREGDGEALPVEVPLRVEESDAPALQEADGVHVGVADGVADCENPVLAVAVAVGEGEGEPVREPLGERERVREAVGVREPLGVGDAVADAGAVILRTRWLR